MSYKPNSESVERLKALVVSIGAMTMLFPTFSMVLLLLVAAGAAGLVLRGGRG